MMTPIVDAVLIELDKSEGGKEADAVEDTEDEDEDCGKQKRERSVTGNTGIMQ
jgi:hypothetical protein